MPDHYDVLGVPRTASTADIRKAYREKARTCHPDRGGDTAEFQKIQSAYEVLGDEERRRQYDAFGDDGPPATPFENPFFSFFANMGGGGGGGAEERHVPVTLEQMYGGAAIRVDVNDEARCSACEGTGSAAKTPRRPCERCRGSGTIVVEERVVGPGMVHRMTARCDRCSGSGAAAVDPEDTCAECEGRGRVAVQDHVEVVVPVGSEDGDAIACQTVAHKKKVRIVLRQTPHATYKRLRTHLFAEATVPLVDALLGARTSLVHLDGRTVDVRMDPVIEPGSWYKIAGEGFPSKKRHDGARGNMYVHVTVEFPTNVDREAVRTALGPSSDIGEGTTIRRVEDVERDMGEDGGGPHQGGCAQQ